MTFAEAAGTTTSCSKATQLTVLVHRFADPVGLGVTADGLVEWINQDDLKELVSRVLAHPV